MIQWPIIEAQTSEAKFYPFGPFCSNTLAQWYVESAGGKIMSGKNNCFGIKATPAQIASGQATLVWTHETNEKGQYVKVVQYFADYESIADCFDAHAHLLTSPHYKDCQSAPTPEAYCVALQKDGYATGIPGHPYAQVLISVINQFNLKQYDRKPQP